MLYHRSQINSIQQISPALLLPSPPMMMLPLLALIISLTRGIHRIIHTLRKAVLGAPVVRQHRAEHGALVVRGDTADDDAVRARRLIARERARFQDGEFEEWFLGLCEGELLIVFDISGLV